MTMVLIEKKIFLSLRVQLEIEIPGYHLIFVFDNSAMPDLSRGVFVMELKGRVEANPPSTKFRFSLKRLKIAVKAKNQRCRRVRSVQPEGAFVRCQHGKALGFRARLQTSHSCCDQEVFHDRC